MKYLSLEDVKYSYRGKYQTVHAVNGVSYTFEPGKMYAIVGKSGCGKTTLLSLMAGLDLPTEGRVCYEGQTTEELDRDMYRRDSAAVIYQSFNLFPLLTVLENVMYPMRLKKVSKNEARDAAAEALNKVGLDDKYHKRFPSMLSGGEQQRVAIARALATNAKIILADEPTGNLDTENSQNIIDTMFNLARTMNTCVIVVTHDSAVADKADVILRMADGRFLADIS